MVWNVNNGQLIKEFQVEGSLYSRIFGRNIYIACTSISSYEKNGTRTRMLILEKDSLKVIGQTKLSENKSIHFSSDSNDHYKYELVPEKASGIYHLLITKLTDESIFRNIKLNGVTTKDNIGDFIYLNNKIILIRTDYKYNSYDSVCVIIDFD